MTGAVAAVEAAWAVWVEAWEALAAAAAALNQPGLYYYFNYCTLAHAFFSTNTHFLIYTHDFVPNHFVTLEMILIKRLITTIKFAQILVTENACSNEVASGHLKDSKRH
jgi:hypothetical protein